MKCKALESLSIGVGGTRAAAIWDVIARAFALHSEPVICPYSEYAGQAPGEDPFDAVDPTPAIGCPLGYDVTAAPGYKPVDHIEAALHRLQVGVPPAAPHDALGPLLVPDDPSNPASHAQVKATAVQQRRAASGLPACVSLAEASLAYPISKDVQQVVSLHAFPSLKLVWPIPSAKRRCLLLVFLRSTFPSG